jgi:hypothetical protein
VRHLRRARFQDGFSFSRFDLRTAPQHAPSLYACAAALYAAAFLVHAIRENQHRRLLVPFSLRIGLPLRVS